MADANQFPIANLSYSNLIATANRVQTRRTALTVLEKSLHMNEFFKKDNFERQNGRMVEFYRPQNFSDAPLTTSTEGSFPTGLSYSNRTVRFAMGQYTDYVMFSTAEIDFSPTPDLQDAAERLGYRGAKRVDDLARAVVDNEKPNMTLSPLATYLGLRDLRNVRTQLKNASVKGLSKFGGMYGCLASPVATYDLTNDPTAGSLLDVQKYTGDQSSNTNLKYAVSTDHIATAANCHIIESNNVTVEVGSPNTYYTYFFGEEAFCASTLSVRTPVLEQRTPMQNRFNIFTERVDKPTSSDPTKEVGGFASYNFYYVAGCLDGPTMIGGTYRARIMPVQSTVA